MNESNEKITINNKFNIGKNTEHFYKNLSWNNKHMITPNMVSFLTTSYKPIISSKELRLSTRQQDSNDIQALFQTPDDVTHNSSYLELLNSFFPVNAGKGILSYDAAADLSHFTSLSGDTQKIRNKSAPRHSSHLPKLSTSSRLSSQNHLQTSQSDTEPSVPADYDLSGDGDDNDVLQKPSNIFQSIMTRYLRLPLSLSTSPHFDGGASPPGSTSTPSPISDKNNLSYKEDHFQNYLHDTVPFIAKISPFLAKQKNNKKNITTPTNLVTRGISFLPSKLFQLLNFSFVPNDIKIHTGSLANKITQHYNADALTLNKNIFLSSDYENTYSPQSIAVIGHELTHIQQRQEVNNLKKQMTPLRHTILETQAFQNERHILNSLLQSNADADLPTMSEYGTSQLSYNLPYQNFEYTNSFRSANSNYQDLPTSKLSSQEEVSLNSNHFDVQTAMTAPELQYTHVRTQTSDVPMLASKSRELESTSNQTVPTQSTPQLDFPAIAETVYQLIKEKIKTERERRGY